MATVYLAERPGASPQPAWVAFSSHDHAGDDLRRRWDDPELRRHGDHPVLFPCAGSHSGAFVPGDYVVTVDPPQLRKALAAARRAQRFLAPWRDQTRPGPGLGIPFIDYARGDGRSVGPGQPEAWTPSLIDDETPWVRDYRGLWGLDTEDHFGGERAPAGPRYERDGLVRHAWADPLGWAGLLKVAPDSAESTELLRATVAALEGSLGEADERIAGERTVLRRVAAEVRSLETHDFARPLVESRRAEMERLEAELLRSIADRAAIAEELRAHLDELRRPAAAPAPQAHLRTRQLPRTPEAAATNPVSPGVGGDQHASTAGVGTGDPAGPAARLGHHPRRARPAVRRRRGVRTPAASVLRRQLRAAGGDRRELRRDRRARASSTGRWPSRWCSASRRWCSWSEIWAT